MKLNPLPILLSLLTLGGVGMLVVSSPATSIVNKATAAPVQEAPSAVADTPTKEELARYESFAFEEMHVLPAGPKGLEFTAKARRLQGQRVRMEGHMVRHYHDDPSIFLFAPVPAVHNQVEYLLADSLPTSLTHVIMTVRPGDAPTWTPRRITVLGTLELGARQEIDGRVSHVRLLCDRVLDSHSGAPLELRKPLALQKDRMAYKAYQTSTLSRLSGAHPENLPTQTRQPSQR